MPMGTQLAKEINLIDDYFEQTDTEFCHRVAQLAEQIVEREDFRKLLQLKNKRRFLDEQYKSLNEYRREELEQMKQNFVSSAYNTARRNFVYKVSPTETPQHLALHRRRAEEALACKVFMQGKPI
jgi:putative two-component system hydrogenase maturation factor HypX/HoxX